MSFRASITGSQRLARVLLRSQARSVHCSQRIQKSAVTGEVCCTHVTLCLPNRSEGPLASVSTPQVATVTVVRRGEETRALSSQISEAALTLVLTRLLTRFDDCGLQRRESLTREPRARSRTSPTCGGTSVVHVAVCVEYERCTIRRVNARRLGLVGTRGVLGPEDLSRWSDQYIFAAPRRKGRHSHRTRLAVMAHAVRSIFSVVDYDVPDKARSLHWWDKDG